MTRAKPVFNPINMFERAMAAKYLERLPDEAIIYTP